MNKEEGWTSTGPKGSFRSPNLRDIFDQKARKQARLNHRGSPPASPQEKGVVFCKSTAKKLLALEKYVDSQGKLKGIRF